MIFRNKIRKFYLQHSDYKGVTVSANTCLVHTTSEFFVIYSVQELDRQSFNILW